MNRFNVVSFFLLVIAFQVHLYGQGSGQPTPGLASQEPKFLMSIRFEDQSAQRQQHILDHPEQYKMRENGMVDVYALPDVNLVPDSPEASDPKPAAANAGVTKPQPNIDPPMKITAKEMLSLPPAVQWRILQHQEVHEITKSELSQKEFDGLRTDQQKTVTANPNLFTIK
jgi:hypothetical protein